MNTAELLQALIKRFEGCRLRTYLCPAGVPTGGWGSTGPDVKLGQTWTQEYSDARMAHDALMFLTASQILVPTALTEGRAAAIADFAYNLGLTRLKGSTLRKRALAGDWDGVKVELAKWTRGGGKVLPGLVARRKAEIDLIS
jgi:lysozyme